MKLKRRREVMKMQRDALVRLVAAAVFIVVVAAIYLYLHG
jgi:hypothetical protein